MSYYRHHLFFCVNERQDGRPCCGYLYFSIVDSIGSLQRILQLLLLFDFYIQRFAYCTILVTSIQLLILMLQLTMCGIAPIEQNLMVGPFPDAYSLWGGRNSYLMLVENEWWRMICLCMSECIRASCSVTVFPHAHTAWSVMTASSARQPV